MRKSIKLTIIYLSLLSLLLSGCADKDGLKVVERDGPMQSGNKTGQQSQEEKADPAAEPSAEKKEESSAVQPSEHEKKPSGTESENPEGNTSPEANDPGAEKQPESEAPADPNAEGSEKTGQDVNGTEREPAVPGQPEQQDPQTQPENGNSGENTEEKPGEPAETPENNAPTKEENPQTEMVADENDYFNGFFSTSLFIGDSRSDGLMRYGHIGYPAKFCHTGLSVYNYDDEDLDVEGFGKISLESLLEKGSFDRVYIGLGINELGYGQDATIRKFEELIDMVKANQPGATIYMLANLHVAAARSKKDKIFNNEKINSLNERISGLCDGTKIIYLDANSLFDDENGDLKKDYTGDNTHLRARCYPSWAQFIYDNSI